MPEGTAEGRPPGAPPVHSLPRALRVAAVRSRGFGSLALALHFLHLLAQAEWAHVRPDLLDVGQARRLVAREARLAPAQRQFAILRPDRILLLVIDHDPIDRRILCLVSVHRWLSISAELSPGRRC